MPGPGIATVLFWVCVRAPMLTIGPDLRTKLSLGVYVPGAGTFKPVLGSSRRPAIVNPCEVFRVDLTRYWPGPGTARDFFCSVLLSRVSVPNLNLGP